MLTANYITKGRKISVKAMTAKIEDQIKARLASSYYSKATKALYRLATPDDIKSLAEKLCGLNDALLNYRDVFANCVKEPRNLDAGRHYYEVYFIDKQGKANLVFTDALYPLIGMIRQDRDRSMRRYLFSSGAIGMSRVLDATDGPFSFLRELTGTYAQI